MLSLSFGTVTNYYSVDLEDTGESQLIIFSDSISSLHPGDEVGVFDLGAITNSYDCSNQIGELLVGAGVWDGSQLIIASTGSVDLCAFGGPQLAGFFAGNHVVVRVYKADEGVEYSTELNWSAGSGTFGDIIQQVSEITLVELGCQDDNDATAAFGGCAGAVAALGCDYVFSGIAISTYCPVTCDSCSDIGGCTNPEACNYDETATVDDGSCEYEVDCAGTCGGDLEPDCCGVCDGDNSQCSNCCGSPFYEDCSDDCAIDLNGVCCYELEVDACGECNGNDTDCNGDGIPDGCEETYTYGYNAGYIDGVITGQIGSDENNDGLVDDFPLITIFGSTALVLTQTHEGNYVDDGASCFAGETNIFQNVVVSGDVVNLSTIGTYVISYNCQDNISGNQAMTKYRTVVVQADYSDEDNDGYDDASYVAGLEEGILIGGQSGDANGDGTLDVLDIVYFIDVILYP